MFTLFAQIAKLGQLTNGDAQYSDFAAVGQGTDVPRQHQQVGTGRGFGAEMGVHLQVQVGHQLYAHRVSSLLSHKNRRLGLYMPRLS